MSPRSKKEYIETVFLRYKKASHKEKTVILNEFCATCGFHRKHAIRVPRRFKRFVQPQSKKRGRVPLYEPDLLLTPPVPNASKRSFLSGSLATIPSPIAEIPSAVSSPMPSTASISPPDGPNNELSGEKVNVTS